MELEKRCYRKVEKGWTIVSCMAIAFMNKPENEAMAVEIKSVSPPPRV